MITNEELKAIASEMGLEEKEFLDSAAFSRPMQCYMDTDGQIPAVAHWLGFGNAVAYRSSSDLRQQIANLWVHLRKTMGPEEINKIQFKHRGTENERS